jgi:hypothetical protein
MAETNWIENFPNAIAVCDLQGIVLDMNEKRILNSKGRRWKSLALSFKG